MLVQILHHNKSAVAAKVDNLMKVPGENKVETKGSGRWQQVLPQTYLKVAFSDPASTDRATVTQFNLGNSAASDIRSSAALLLYKMQRMRIEATLSHQPSGPSFVIFQVMWDLASFKVVIPPLGANVHPIMGAHGMLTYRVGDTVFNEEVVIPPTPTWNETAESMMSVLKRHCGWALKLEGNGDQHFTLLNLGCDSARSNIRLMNSIGGTTPSLIMKGRCRNHSIGLCLEPMCVFLGVLCPAFCTIQRLHSATFHTRFLKTLFSVIDSRLVVFSSVNDIGYKPCAADRKYAEMVLELTYYKRDLHRSFANDEEKSKLVEEDRARRARGQRLLNMLVGDWRSKHITFYASGQYANVTREQAVHLVMEAFLDICPHIIPVPAKNKWLSVLPAVADLARGCCIHRLTSEVILCMAGQPVEVRERASDDEAEAFAVGMQDDEFQQVNQRRQNKMVKWMKDPLTLPRLLLWLSVCVTALRLHYVLFRDAKAGLPSGGAREASSPTKENSEKHAVFNLCNPRRSKARQVLYEMSAMLRASDQHHCRMWGVLYRLFDDKWPEEFLRQARSATLVVMGNVWRRLVVEYENYPWCLAAAVDPSVPQNERETVAKAFYNAKECCLDSGFGRPLRAKIPQSSFFRPENQSFIYFAFARTVCSTAFVECMFASFNQWMSKSSKPLRLSSLASRHVTHAFMRSWKARVGKQQTPTTGRRICKEARIGFDLMSGRMFFCNL